MIRVYYCLPASLLFYSIVRKCVSVYIWRSNTERMQVGNWTKICRQDGTDAVRFHTERFRLTAALCIQFYTANVQHI